MLEDDIDTEKNNINNINRAISRMYLILIYDISKELELVNKELSEKENERDLNSNMILFYKEQLSTLYNRKTELENILKVSISDSTLKQMTELYANILSKVNSYDKKYKEEGA